MKPTKWSELDPALRNELDPLLARPTDAFYSDYKDALGYRGLALLACCGVIVGGAWHLATSELSLGVRVAMWTVNPGSLLQSPVVLALPIAVGLAAWVTVAALRERGKRGYAALSNAAVIVRGSKAIVLPYSEITHVERQAMGQRGGRFTSLTFTFRDGRKMSVNANGNWADELQKRLP